MTTTKQTVLQKRGKLAAMDDEGSYWFYGWDLTDDDLNWPMTDEPTEFTKENTYARWGINPNNDEMGSILWTAEGPKQGAFKVTLVVEEF